MEAVNKSFPDSVLEEAGNYHAKELAKILGKFLSAEEAFKRSLQKIIFMETLALSLIHQSGNPDNNNPAEASTGTNATQPSTPSKSQTKKNSALNQGNNNPASKTPSPETDTSSPSEQSTSTENQNPPVAGTKAAELWRKFLAEISSEESFVSFTLKDSILLKEDGSNLEIGIQPELAHQIGLLEDNIDDLEMKLSRIARKKIRLMFKAIEGRKGVKPIKSNHSGAVDDVLDIFKGEIVR
ncbi:hypothetical protein GF338_10510 [candidate division WOR-3 bacterium]|nr:hypothetical protein [candidate division WOR-3 bacterium]